MDDYVRDTTRHPKWHVSRIRGVIPTNGWNVKGLFFFSFFIVSSAPLGVKPLDRFWQVISQNACFWVSCIPRGIKIQNVSVFPHFCPKNTQKGAWIGIFKLNAQNIKTCVLSKLLHRLKPNFAQWQRPPKYTSRVVQTGIQQIQDGGRPPSWKIEYGHISATL